MKKLIILLMISGVIACFISNGNARVIVGDNLRYLPLRLSPFGRSRNTDSRIQPYLNENPQIDKERIYVSWQEEGVTKLGMRPDVFSKLAQLKTHFIIDLITGIEEYLQNENLSEEEVTELRESLKLLRHAQVASIYFDFQSVAEYMREAKQILDKYSNLDFIQKVEQNYKDAVNEALKGIKIYIGVPLPFPITIKIQELKQGKPFKFGYEEVEEVNINDPWDWEPVIKGFQQFYRTSPYFYKRFLHLYEGQGMHRFPYFYKGFLPFPYYWFIPNIF